MNAAPIVTLGLIACVAGCATPRQPSNYGSRHSVRLQQPPDKAAACFAHNAEEHSSALVAEVRPARDGAQVIVSVKNGVLYATADFQRAGSGSTARVTLNVTTNRAGSELLDALTEGC